MSLCPEKNVCEERKTLKAKKRLRSGITSESLQPMSVPCQDSDSTNDAKHASKNSSFETNLTCDSTLASEKAFSPTPSLLENSSSCCVQDNTPIDSLSLSETVNRLKEELQTERDHRIRNENEIKELRSSLELVSDRLDESRLWQNTVYEEISKFNKQCELSYHQNDGQYFESASSFTASIPDVSTSENASVESQPMAYRGGLASIHERRILKTYSSSDGMNNALAFDEVELISDDEQEEKMNSSPEPEISESYLEAKQETDMQPEKDCIDLLHLQKKCVIDNNDEKTEDVSNGAAGDTSSDTLNLRESLAEAASAAMSSTGMTYDEQSGQYYDWNCQMYYDPQTQLYYDHQNGIYYSYDTEKGSYIFHSQVEVEKLDSVAEIGVTSIPSDGEDGEISPDESTDCVTSCIRLIVVKSPSLVIGSLFIVTCTGGTIGRDCTNLIQLREVAVSKQHVRIVYSEQYQAFFLQDLQTVNGTLLNNERLAEAKCHHEPVELCHRDYINIANNVFRVHIHCGLETCFDCEPGHVQAVVSQRSRNIEEVNMKCLNEQRKQEAKNMRQKYGLKGGWIPTPSIPDRSAARRKKVGSQAYTDAEKPTVQASVHREISTSNVGHKMLAKMGWREGEGLGKAGVGIRAPVNVGILKKNQGLGASNSTSIDNPTNVNAKSNVWAKTKQRYDNIK